MGEEGALVWEAPVLAEPRGYPCWVPSLFLPFVSCLASIFMDVKCVPWNTVFRGFKKRVPGLNKFGKC